MVCHLSARFLESLINKKGYKQKMGVYRKHRSSINASKTILLQNDREMAGDKDAHLEARPMPIQESLAAGFHWLFLPRGYPQSVSEDYFQYQVWDTLQGFCDYLKGILLTLSFLKGKRFPISLACTLPAMGLCAFHDRTHTISTLANPTMYPMNGDPLPCRARCGQQDSFSRFRHARVDSEGHDRGLLRLDSRHAHVHNTLF